MLAPLFVPLVGTTETNTGFWWDSAILFANLLVAVTGLLIVVLAILFAMIRNLSLPETPSARKALPSARITDAKAAQEF